MAHIARYFSSEKKKHTEQKKHHFLWTAVSDQRLCINTHKFGISACNDNLFSAISTVIVLRLKKLLNLFEAISISDFEIDFVFLSIHRRIYVVICWKWVSYCSLAWGHNKTASYIFFRFYTLLSKYLTHVGNGKQTLPCYM
jgi:hypothetical protein